jgi:hypothetical protein
MNEAPRGTVRRSAEGALLVREFRGDNLGWKLVPSESEHCVFFGDHIRRHRSCATEATESSDTVARGGRLDARRLVGDALVNN